jgi:hypothetical protein
VPPHPAQTKEKAPPKQGQAGDEAEAVVLDFVNPQAAGRQLIGFGWEARRDESRREGTQQHAD